jgi:hypothetical protein
MQGKRVPLQGKTVLYAWELGEGLGHLPVLKAFAEGLKADGVQARFVLREIKGAAQVLASTGGTLHSAPHWAKPALPQVRSRSLADIMASNGYSQADHAAAILSAWDRVINTIKPDLIVCDHAPSACLAAHGRIPVAIVGNGFAVTPTDGDWFPEFAPGEGKPENQAYVFEAIQGAFKSLGRPPLSSITAPFKGAFRGVYTFPVLDTYRAVRQEKLLGPIEAQPPLSPLPKQRRIFFYTAADFARIDALTHCIMDLGAEASVYMRGQVGPRASILRSRGVEVFDTPPRLADLLPQVSCVFSHVGPGFTNAALTGGRPHIMFPRHFEAHAAALGLVGLGCGIRLDDLTPDKFRAAFERASGDPHMQDAAQQAGAEAQTFMRDARALEVSLAALRALLA